jgi:hypothetical protein
MYIKRYSISAILFLVLVGWAIFAFITQESVPQINLIWGYFIPELPTAIVVLIPAITLFVLTLSHMLFYKVVEFVKNRSKDSDFKKLEGAIFMNLKGKIDEKPQYSSSLYKDMGELLNIAKIELNNGAELNSDNKFKDLVKIIVSLKNGEVLSLESSVGYHLKELNHWNALREDPHSAEAILMERGFYSDELYIEAFNNLCKVNTYSTIQRYIKWFNVEALFNILKRVDAEEDGILLSKDEIFDLVDSVSFSKENYTKLAKIIKDSSMSPDFRLELFKHLVEKSDDAIEGYLYTLLNLEMISEAEESLTELQAEDLAHVKAYIILKKSNPTLLDIDYFFRG